MSRLTRIPTSWKSAAPSLRAFAHRHLTALFILGAVAIVAAPQAVATNGQPLLIGVFGQTATSSTNIQTTNGDGISAVTDEPNSGSSGLFGRSDGGGDGVHGRSLNRNGVSGESLSATSSGVYGENFQGGFGVAGRASLTGVAVFADNADPAGVALRTTGRLQFQNRSGIATVASGKKSVVVTLAGVTTSSMVMATVQRSGGFFAQAVVPANGSFTIYLNKSPVAPTTVKVAYLVLN